MGPGWDSLIPNTEERQTQASHLFNAWLVGVEQRPRLHMFGHQAAAHARDVLPVSQGQQRHVLFRGLPLPCGRQRSAHTSAQQNKRPVLGQGLKGTQRPLLRSTDGETEAQREMQQPKLSAASWAQRGLCSWVFPAWGETDPRIPLGCKVREEKKLCPVQHLEGGWHKLPAETFAGSP